jgi:hypothetical protein
VEQTVAELNESLNRYIITLSVALINSISFKGVILVPSKRVSERFPYPLADHLSEAEALVPSPLNADAASTM